MDFSRLESLCSGLLPELVTLGKEIDSVSRADCEKILTDIVHDSIKKYVQKRKAQRDQLKMQCQDIIVEMSRKRRLLAEPDTPGDNTEYADLYDQTLSPPYQQLSDSLSKELEGLLTIVAERSRKKNRLQVSISQISDVLNFPPPQLSESLAESNISRISSVLQNLQQEKDQRLKKVSTLFEKVSTMEGFIRSECRTEMPTKLDDHTINTLHEHSERVSIIYEQRRTEVYHLVMQIKSLAATLEENFDIGDASDGSLQRVSYLQQELAHLNELKGQRLGIFIQRSQSRIEDLWKRLFLDVSQRRRFDVKEATPDQLNLVEAEVLRLEKMMVQPGRAKILGLLEKFQMIASNEKRLKEMSQDSGRLARRGFAASLKEEERLRRFNEKHKPEVVRQLLQLVGEWKEKNNDETFYLETESGIQELFKVLQSEQGNSLRRMSVNRKKPGPPVTRRGNIPAGPGNINERRSTGFEERKTTGVMRGDPTRRPAGSKAIANTSSNAVRPALSIPNIRQPATTSRIATTNASTNSNTNSNANANTDANTYTNTNTNFKNKAAPTRVTLPPGKVQKARHPAPRAPTAAPAMLARRAMNQVARNPNQSTPISLVNKMSMPEYTPGSGRLQKIPQARFSPIRRASNHTAITPLAERTKPGPQLASRHHRQQQPTKPMIPPTQSNSSFNKPLAGNPPISLPQGLVPPPNWEDEEYCRLQRLEMSYFDETSAIEPSFDYNRDAF